MEEHFIISLSTLPSRYESLKLCLESLFKQNYNNYEIHLNIPKVNIFEGNYTHNLNFNNNKLKVYYVDDIGPITKIYYTLKRVNNINQRIISVDDDIIYDENMLKIYNTILSRHHEYHKCCIGFVGIYPYNNNGAWDNIFFINGNNKIPVYVGILEGYKSICYQKWFFDNDFFESIINKDMKWANNEIYYEDDIVINSYLGYKNIKRIVIPPKFIDIEKSYNFPIKALITLNNIKSGCNKYRELYGSSFKNIKKFYESKYGKYIRDDSLIKIHIGKSEENSKTIELDKIYPENTELIFIHKHKDTFSYIINEKFLTVTRTDIKGGWGQDLVAFLKF
jgi:hypothetical protein